MKYPEQIYFEQVEELTSLSECLTAQLEDAEARIAQLELVLHWIDKNPYADTITRDRKVRAVLKDAEQ